MKKNKIVYVALVIFLLLSTTSCMVLKPLEFVRVNSFKVGEKSGTKGIVVTTNLTLSNPNKFNVLINKTDIDVYAEGVNLGKLKVPENIEIEANKEFSSDFYIEISFTKLLLAGNNIISKIKSGKMEVQLKGTIDADVLWKHKIIQVDFTQNINLK